MFGLYVLLYASFVADLANFFLIFPFLVKFIRLAKRLKWKVRSIRTNFQSLSYIAHTLYLIIISIGVLVGIVSLIPSHIPFIQMLEEKSINPNTDGGMAYHALSTNVELATISIFTFFCAKELYVQKHSNRRWLWARRFIVPFWILFVALYDAVTILFWILMPRESSIDDDPQDPIFFQLGLAANATSSVVLVGATVYLWRTVNYTQRHMPFQSTLAIFLTYLANALFLLTVNSLTLSPYRPYAVHIFPFCTFSQRLAFLLLFGSPKPLPEPIRFEKLLGEGEAERE